MSNICAHKVPPSTAEARGDMAAGSPATSVAQACSKRSTISSSKDETSNNVTQGVGMKTTYKEPLAKLDAILTESARKRQRHMIILLTRKVEEMVLDNDHVWVNTGCSVETPGPIGASLAWQPTSGRRPWPAHPGNPQDDDRPDENMGINDPPLENPPPEGGGGTGVPPGGGGGPGHGSCDNEVMRDSNMRTPKSLGRKTQ